MAETEVYVAPDTNVLLHFHSFDHIDWPALVGGKSVTLVFSRTVVAEIDRHKNEHKNAKLRDRAGKVQAKILQFAESQSGEVRPKVYIETQISYPKEAPEELDLSKPDDRHLAAALAIKNKLGKPTYIATADVGMRLTAKAIGLDVVDLPESQRHPVEPDELEQELRKLKIENERLKAVKQPKLSLRHSDGSHVKVSHLRARGLMSDREIHDEVAEDLESEPKLAALAAAGLGNIDGYRETLLAYYRSKREFDGDVALTVKLDLTLFNEGDAPAQGVHVYVDFPDHVSVRSELPEEPAKPQWPLMPKFFDMPSVALYDVDAWELEGKTARAYRSQVVQSVHLDLPPLFVRPIDRDDRQKVVLRVRIVVSNPPSQDETGLVLTLDGSAK